MTDETDWDDMTPAEKMVAEKHARWAYQDQVNANRMAKMGYVFVRGSGWVTQAQIDAMYYKPLPLRADQKFR